MRIQSRPSDGGMFGWVAEKSHRNVSSESAEDVVPPLMCYYLAQFDRACLLANSLGGLCGCVRE